MLNNCFGNAVKDHEFSSRESPNHKMTPVKAAKIAVPDSSGLGYPVSSVCAIIGQKKVSHSCSTHDSATFREFPKGSGRLGAEDSAA